MCPTKTRVFNRDLVVSRENKTYKNSYYSERKLWKNISSIKYCFFDIFWLVHDLLRRVSLCKYSCWTIWALSFFYSSLGQFPAKSAQSSAKIGWRHIQGWTGYWGWNAIAMTNSIIKFRHIGPTLRNVKCQHYQTYFVNNHLSSKWQYPLLLSILP